MVDLGFILITFFIYTTTIAKPGSLEILMPSDEKTDMPMMYNDESTITLIPVGHHNVAYYHGQLSGPEQLKKTSVDNIKNILMQMKKQVSDLPLSYSIQAHKLHVVIKPADDCRYEDVVRILDDMNLVAVTYYALVDITPEEKEMAKNFN